MRLYSDVVKPVVPPSVAAVTPDVASEGPPQPEVVEIQPDEEGWQFVGRRKSRRRIDSRTTPIKRKISREESANTRKRHMASSPPKIDSKKASRKRLITSSPQHAKGRPGRCSKEPATKVTSQVSDGLILYPDLIEKHIH